LLIPEKLLSDLKVWDGGQQVVEVHEGLIKTHQLVGLIGVVGEGWRGVIHPALGVGNEALGAPEELPNP